MYYPNFDQFKKHINRMYVQKGDQLLILVGYKSEEYLSSMFEYLNSENIQFFGGVFPGLLIGDKCLREGFMVQKVTSLYDSIITPSMMKMLLNKKELNNATAVVLIDALSSKTKDIIEKLYSKFGSALNYIGGGAGFYNLEHKPCIFNNNGLHKDVGLVCVIKNKVTSVVEHGWKKLRGPFEVTKSTDNILLELDKRPAFEIYKDIIEEEQNIILSTEDFFTFAKDHPFGILQNDGNILVRDPIGITGDNSIVCAADIPPESKVYVLRGDINSLLFSSLSISKNLLKQNESTHYKPLLFNCISRAMFMENRFEEELSNIQNNFDSQVEGVLSIGEIASNKEGNLIIHNKSILLGVLSMDTP